MKLWVAYGLFAALLVSASDMTRKYLTQTVHPLLVIIIPLWVAGLISLLIYSSSKKDLSLQSISKKEFCILILIGCLIPVGHYCITKTLQTIHNPGYAKTIVSLNVIISLFLSLYIFKDSSLSYKALSGVVLVLIGSYLVTK